MRLELGFLIRTIFCLLLPLASFAAEPEINIEFAYRDSGSAIAGENRTVSLQGLRNSSFHFETICGSAGENCSCKFYRSVMDRSPVTGVAVGLSAQSNSLSCVVPGSISDDELRGNGLPFVQMKQINVPNGQSALIAIWTTLTLEDVLGRKLDKSNVRGIFRYSCNRTFFEGEGVAHGTISCVPGQHLGVIGANYNFYTYRSAMDSNNPGGDSPFPGDICGLNNFLKIQCMGNTPELRYGFYRERAGAFVVGVSMTRAPEGDNLNSSYGFAALPDSGGHCPAGLVKARAWLAQPASMMKPASNFINTNNSLNNTVLEIAPPANFMVMRQANQLPCDARGDCTNAEFGGAEQVQDVPYTALAPVICVIPPGLLSGIF